MRVDGLGYGYGRAPGGDVPQRQRVLVVRRSREQFVPVGGRARRLRQVKHVVVGRHRIAWLVGEYERVLARVHFEDLARLSAVRGGRVVEVCQLFRRSGYELERRPRGIDRDVAPALPHIRGWRIVEIGKRLGGVCAVVVLEIRRDANAERERERVRDAVRVEEEPVASLIRGVLRQIGVENPNCRPRSGDLLEHGNRADLMAVVRVARVRRRAAQRGREYEVREPRVALPDADTVTTEQL